MKHPFLGVLVALIVSACSTQPQSSRNMDRYPDDFARVLEAHGGLVQWDAMKTLRFGIPKEGFEEVHTIDLHSRMDRVESPAYDIGFDGTSAWSKDKAEKYEGDPSFRHDLMFYFFAMPFVLADEGINYGETEPLEHEGKSYPGIKITFNNGVGASSEDVYFLYYEPSSYQMAWLGYRATFGKELKPGPPSIIKYDQWAAVEGVTLPASIAWQQVENGQILGDRNRVDFIGVTLADEARPADFYSKEWVETK
ncbi:hypothetical protein J0A68_19035 [Algoriphagus sp. H41]|uniref:Uncharacterized protein n=1 Tax=Algoriphagus oliviformis TaxID=2811231 RepID=A0ABS3C7H1_9BACT|nr:DUF6503 family protein [Algoriphagus oliviformis]MBN7813057.1 hypothetical protein [Algoriphagus oliviformis]